MQKSRPGNLNLQHAKPKQTSLRTIARKLNMSNWKRDNPMPATFGVSVVAAQGNQDLPEKRAFLTSWQQEGADRKTQPRGPNVDTTGSTPLSCRTFHVRPKPKRNLNCQSKVAGDLREYPIVGRAKLSQRCCAAHKQVNQNSGVGAFLERPNGGFQKLGAVVGSGYNEDHCIFRGQFWGLCLWKPSKGRKNR